MIIFMVFKFSLALAVAMFPAQQPELGGDSMPADEPALLAEHAWTYPIVPWGEPVSNTFGKLRKEFAAPATAWGSGHRGIDFYAPSGTDLRSPAAGTVTFVGTVGQRRLITIEDALGRQATLEPACSRIKQGAKVTRGQVVGSVCSGTTQYETHCNNCAHLGARVNGFYISPLVLMGDFQASVLKAN